MRQITEEGIPLIDFEDLAGPKSSERGSVKDLPKIVAENWPGPVVERNEVQKLFPGGLMHQASDLDLLFPNVGKRK